MKAIRTALSIEFVAKPENARNAPAFLPTAINKALREVTGFAGCLVVVSEEEPRLITVVTFWTGRHDRNCCSKNAQRVHALLSNDIDRCLRVRTLMAHPPGFPATQTKTNITAADSMMQESAVMEENACVA